MKLIKEIRKRILNMYMNDKNSSNEHRKVELNVHTRVTKTPIIYLNSSKCIAIVSLQLQFFVNYCFILIAQSSTMEAIHCFLKLNFACKCFNCFLNDASKNQKKKRHEINEKRIKWNETY